MDYRKKIAEMRMEKAAVRYKQERTNVYICDKCRHAMVTIDVDEGTTPMFTRCEVEGCNGTAGSTMYRAVTLLSPTVEWYRPDEKELASLSPGTQDHVKRGGLIRRSIKERTAPPVKEE